MMLPNMFDHLVLSIKLFHAPWSFTDVPRRRDVLGSNMADQVLFTGEGPCRVTIAPLAT